VELAQVVKAARGLEAALPRRPARGLPAEGAFADAFLVLVDEAAQGGRGATIVLADVARQRADDRGVCVEEHVVRAHDEHRAGGRDALRPPDRDHGVRVVRDLDLYPAAREVRGYPAAEAPGGAPRFRLEWTALDADGLAPEHLVTRNAGPPMTKFSAAWNA
jgi:hypothetical protein